MGDYRDTLNLPETSFPMRAQLAAREPEMLAHMQTSKLYERVRTACKGRPKFVLHDGPPYANGDIHMGHVVNKCLKDFVSRSKLILGYDSTYIPGWDCHGLPIERELEKQKVSKEDSIEFRRKCREFADSQIAIQRAGFERLGVLGDWDNHYRTMHPPTEANIIRALGALQRTGLVYRGLRPVLHCSVCRSSLAEAEIEYEDRTSQAIDVAYSAVDPAAVAAIFGVTPPEHVAAVIWTTTPWTLPASLCLVVNPELEYVWLETDKGVFIVAAQLADVCLARWGLSGTATIKVAGTKLVDLQFKHPFYAREIPIYGAEHATAEEGTGLVHTAPAHGEEDYVVGVEHDLELNCPVDDGGCYYDWVEHFAGMEVWEAVPAIVAAMRANGSLLAAHDYQHSYPVCWRHKKPVLFRTSLQWFVAMDQKTNRGKSLRETSLDAINQTEFFPAWGRERITSMVSNRPDWCLSRQRMWNSPVAFFVHKQTGELHPRSDELIEQIAARVAQDGIEAWFALPVEELLGDEAQDYEKVSDTLDVWFDSGVTHQAVMKWEGGKENRPDMYLEGSDQHRGWFMSSLMTACALYGEPPWRQVLTHGFVVGGDGRKMSKSLGNTLSPQKILSQHGADILRMWVAMSDYSQEIKLSEEVLRTNIDSYRLLRNRIRFLLANSADFDPATDAVAPADLAEIDRYILLCAEQCRASIHELLDNYNFHAAMQQLHNFCNLDLGRFYFDIIKDRLYTLPQTCHARRSAQSAIYHLTNMVLVALGPILPYTADEAWQIHTGDSQASTMLTTLEPLPEVEDADELTARWEVVRTWRARVSKAIEEARTSKQIDCADIELQIKLQVPAAEHAVLATLSQADLANVMLVSALELGEGETEVIEVVQAEFAKCERCWRRAAGTGEGTTSAICSRCEDALAGVVNDDRQA